MITSHFHMFNVTCFSHTIDNVGKQFEFGVLNTFSRYWNSMFSLSPAAGCPYNKENKDRKRNASKPRNEVHVGVSGKSYGLVMQYFGDGEPFLRAETRRSKTVSRATGRYAATSFDQLLVCSRFLFEGVA